jgi:hypothetical protein
VKRFISITLLLSFLFATAVPAAVIDCCCEAMTEEVDACCDSKSEESASCCSEKEPVSLKKFDEKAAFFLDKTDGKTTKLLSLGNKTVPTDLVYFAFNRALILLIPFPNAPPTRVPGRTEKIYTFTHYTSHLYAGIDFSIWRC